MRKWIVSLASVILTSQIAHAYSYSDYTWYEYNGHQYAITLDWSNWAQAEEWAQEVGGHLATVNNDEENSWLSTTFQCYYAQGHYGDNNTSLVWIGFYRIDNNWYWVSGEPVTYPPPWYDGGTPHGGLHAYLHTDTHHLPGTWWEDKVYDGTDPSYCVRGIIEIANLPTIEGCADIDPDTLNLKSKGKWITCYIELPEGYDVADIDVSTIKLNDTVPAEAKPTAIGDYDGDGIADLMVKFDRSAVQALLQEGEVELTVTGELTDETPFEGSDTIRVINPGGKK